MKFLVAFLLPALAGAAIWPDAIGAFHKIATPANTLLDRAVWDECGLAETEAAVYENTGKKFTATAWRPARLNRRPGRLRLAAELQGGALHRGRAGRGNPHHAPGGARELRALL